VVLCHMGMMGAIPSIFAHSLTCLRKSYVVETPA
jgi:hypothetical protein